MIQLKVCHHVVVLTIICMQFQVFSQEAGDTIIGRWYTEKCKAAFDFFRSSNGYCAALVPFEKPDLIDVKNPVDSLRNRSLRGATTIYGLRYDAGQRRWHGGKVYNPENGKTYSCYCTITDRGTMVFRGYIGVGLLGGSQTWTRNGCGKK